MESKENTRIVGGELSQADLSIRITRIVGYVLDMRKQHLTLTVDDELVKKAKNLGLNISELTERALKAHTYPTKEANQPALYDAYRNLFSSMLPLLQRFRTSVKIGSFKDFDPKSGMLAEEGEVNLSYDGSFWIWAYEEVHDEFSDITRIPLYNLDSPMEIYRNLLNAIEQAAKRDGSLLMTIAAVKGLVDATTVAMQSGAKSENKNRKRKRRMSK